ncbi:hypothetical protein [Azospirillum sp. TSA6c]|uniref:hypothetical protein n=1 Tax=unclassified Azospirillum TaxID=2630922 RepID=UPI0011B56B2E|nr:hypothetical protein [Azospirillum sp. TSA6c]
MLFLRDIDADVQLRCRACGHGGVLPRAMLERRFGPNYPVLSIAPHYRCSRCDSRDIESRPILAVPSLPTAAPADDEPSFDAPLAALNGLLASLRGNDGPDTAGDRDPPAPPPPPPPVPTRAKPLSELPLSDLVADGPGDGEAEPLWEPVSLADMAARLGRSSPPDEWDDDPDEEPTAGDPGFPAKLPANDTLPEPGGIPDDDDEDGDDETLMAMRQLLAQAYGSDDEFDDDQGDDRGGDQEDERDGAMPQSPAGRAANPADRRPADDFDSDGFSDDSSGGRPASGHDDDEPPVFSHKVLVRRDFEDEWADSDTDTDADPWAADADDDDREDGFDHGEPDGEEPSEEDILSFAIRDPEKPVKASRPAKPVPPPAAEPLDFDQHRAERRALRPSPPEDEEGFDRTLAALRSMIEDAASGTEEEDAPPPPRRTSRGAGQTADRSAAKPVDKPLPREEEEDEPPAGRDDDDGWSLPAGWGDPDPAPEPPAPESASPDMPPAGRRSAQEREIEEAMKALRVLIEDEVNADPPVSPTASPLPSPPAPPPTQPKPRAGKPRQARGGPAAPDAVRPQSVQAPDVAPPDEDLSGKPAGEPTPLSKTIAALRGMLELDGRRKR